VKSRIARARAALSAVLEGGILPDFRHNFVLEGEVLDAFITQFRQIAPAHILAIGSLTPASQCKCADGSPEPSAQPWGRIFYQSPPPSECAPRMQPVGVPLARNRPAQLPLDRHLDQAVPKPGRDRPQSPVRRFRANR
jgi:hypothetical protein